ncbi:MAG: anti-sigma factor family protein [bacterium]|nr:zf-HC2 domain-containing protein [bacterium]
MKCRYREDLISAYIDAELLPVENESVKRHLAVCADCRLRLEKMSISRRSLQRLCHVDLPAGFAARLHAGLIDAKQDRVNSWWQKLLHGITAIRYPFELAGAGALVILLALVTMHGIQDGQYMETPLKENRNVAVEAKQPENKPATDERMQVAAGTKNRLHVKTEIPANDILPDVEERSAIDIAKDKAVSPMVSSPALIKQQRNSGANSEKMCSDNNDNALQAREAPRLYEAESGRFSERRSLPYKAGTSAPTAPSAMKSEIAVAFAVEKQPFAGIKVGRDRIILEVVAPSSIRAGHSDNKSNDAVSPAGRSLELRSASSARQAFVLTDAGLWSGNWSVFIPHTESIGKDKAKESILSMSATTTVRFEALADLSRNVIISPSYLMERDLSAEAARLDTWQDLIQAIPGIMPVNGEGYILLLPQR